MNKYQEALEARFGKNNKRYIHSLGVARTASSLGKRYGVSEEDAYIAGLLHDWEKNKSVEDVLLAAKTAGLSEKLPAPVLHGPLAAKTLRMTFPELSDSILSAIAKHTTGARTMSDLDKVVFVADAIEPGRKTNKATEKLRALAKTASLNELYREAYIASLSYVLEKHQELSIDSVAIYNNLIRSDR